MNDGPKAVVSTWGAPLKDIWSCAYDNATKRPYQNFYISGSINAVAELAYEAQQGLSDDDPGLVAQSTR